MQETVYLVNLTVLYCIFTAYQTVSLSNRMGGVVIQASVEGYDCDILRLCGQELKV